MEGVLNTSGQSAYHSCRQSFENMGIQNGDGDHPVQNIPNGDGDSTFVCQKDSSSAAVSPSSADVSALVQSNVIAESTRTSIQMNGSGFGNGSGDDSSTYDPQPVLLAQKLTNHANSSTPFDSSEPCGNPTLNDCLINSALGCSVTTNNSGESNNLMSTTPLRSKQVEQEVIPDSEEVNGVDCDLGTDENGAEVRQTRSGSFTVVRDKAIPGTPVIEDEPIVEEQEPVVRNGSVTPPAASRSPGLMQDSASRPLIPKAKNRKSVWTADVFSPTILSNMNNGEATSDQILQPTLQPTNLVASSASPIVQPLVNTNFSPVAAVVTASPSPSPSSSTVTTSSSATYSRSTGSKMLLEAIATTGLSVDASSVPLVVNNNSNNGLDELSFHSSNGRGSSNGNHSYENCNTEENGVTSVVDAGNVSTALSGRGSSSSNHRGVTPPAVEDGVVGTGKLEFMGVGSSATITKSKPTPVRHQSPVVSALPPHMMSPAVTNNICPPMPPASSSPKPYLIGSNGNGTTAAMSPSDGKTDAHALCTTPILPAGSGANGNGCLTADDADRIELLARISQLELENSTLKSKFAKFEDITHQLVVRCSNHFNSAPSPSDLEEFLKFVHARLLAAEEVSDDYRSLESSFNELHRRYERARAVIAESQARDRQLQADLATMKQAADVADQRVNTLIRDFETKLGDVEARNTSLEEHLQTEQLKGELRVGQMEIEARNLQQQLQQKDSQISDLNRLLANAMASTARRG